MSIALVLRHPAVSILLTLLAYLLAMRLHHRWRWIPPFVAAFTPLAILLLLLHEPFAEYNKGGSLLVWLLGPATVALAVPMYRNGRRLSRSLPILALIVLAGSVVGMITAGVTAWLLGAPMNVVMATVPKSVTTPIAIEVCKELNGIPQITVAMVLLAGVWGPVSACRCCGYWECARTVLSAPLSAHPRMAWARLAWCAARRCRLPSPLGQWPRRGSSPRCWRRF